MKRKILSISFMLIFCLTSMFIFSACGENKEKEVIDVRALSEETLNVALDDLKQTESIKMSLTAPFNVAEFLIISTENNSYMKLKLANVGEFADTMTTTTWTKFEHDAYATYSHFYMQKDDLVDDYGTKTVSLKKDHFLDNIYMQSIFGALDFENFLEASISNETTTIVFSKDDAKFTAKIVGNKFKSVTINQNLLSLTLNCYYGDYLHEIPTVIHKDWQVESKIEIPNIKTQYSIGEELSLVGLKFNLYESTSSYNYVEIAIAEEILNKITLEDFNTATITETDKPRKMKITYLGLELVVEYTVV